MGINNESNQRIEWIDMARGYGILCIMLGHLPAGKLVDEVYTFHLPLFFVISGFFFRGYKLSFGGFLKKSVKTLLIPYFFMGLILQINCWLFWDFGNMAAIKKYAMELLVQNRVHTIWYLTCLFCAQIIFYVITRYLVRTKFQIIVLSVMLAGVGLAYYHTGGTSLPWNVDVSLIAVFFLAVGFCMQDIEIKWNYFTLVLAIIVNLICAYGNDRMVGRQLEMFNMQYAIIPFTLLACFAGIYVICFVSRLKTIKWINYVGKHSMLYFGLHQGITMPAVDIIYGKLNIDPIGSGLLTRSVYIIVSMTFSIAAITLIHMLISRTKAKILIGE